MSHLAAAILDKGIYLDKFRNPHGQREAWQVYGRDGKLIAQANVRETAIEKAVKALEKSDFVAV